MSMAWEVTLEDVMIVLQRNNITMTEKRAQKLLDDLDTDEIEAAVLWYTDFDDQCYAALDDIERQLKEAGVIE